MFSSLRYIDYNIEDYLKECFMIGHYSNGCYSKSYLDTMPFDEFEIVLKEAQRVEGLLKGTDNSSGEDKSGDSVNG